MLSAAQAKLSRDTAPREARTHCSCCIQRGRPLCRIPRPRVITEPLRPVVPAEILASTRTAAAAIARVAERRRRLIDAPPAEAVHQIDFRRQIEGGTCCSGAGVVATAGGASRRRSCCLHCDLFPDCLAGSVSQSPSHFSEFQPQFGLQAVHPGRDLHRKCTQMCVHSSLFAQYSCQGLLECCFPWPCNIKVRQRQQH